MVNVHDHELGNGFLDKTPKAHANQVKKKKNRQVGLHQI